jgi:tetratricopeptide (TPR) repeat protein
MAGSAQKLLLAACAVAALLPGPAHGEPVDGPSGADGLARADAWEAVLKEKVEATMFDCRSSRSCLEGELQVRVPADQVEWMRRAGPAAARAVEACLAGFPEPAEPVQVVLLESLDELSALSQVPASKLEASGTVGMTLAGRIVLLSPAVFPNGYEWDVALCHETAHLALHGTGAAKLPLPLEEGLASLLDTRSTSGALRELSPLDRALLALAAEKQLLQEWEALESPFWTRESDLLARLATLQALLLARSFVEKAGDGGPAALVNQVRAGKDWKAAVEELTGLTWESLLGRARARWKSAGSRQHLSVWMFARGQDFLPEKGRKAVEEGKRLVFLADLLWGRGRNEAALTTYLRLAPELQSTPEVVWRITRLLAEQGRSAEALERAETALSLFPDDSRVLFQAASLLLSQGGAGKADLHRRGEELARRAWLLNPFANETNAMLDRLGPESSASGAGGRGRQ